MLCQQATFNIRPAIVRIGGKPTSARRSSTRACATSPSAAPDSATPHPVRDALPTRCSGPRRRDRQAALRAGCRTQRPRWTAMNPDRRDRLKRSMPQARTAAVRTGPFPDDPHEIAYHRRHPSDDPNEASPGRDARSSSPAKVCATMRAALAAAPPKRFRQTHTLRTAHRLAPGCPRTVGAPSPRRDQQPASPARTRSRITLCCVLSLSPDVPVRGTRRHPRRHREHRRPHRHNPSSTTTRGQYRLQRRDP